MLKYLTFDKEQIKKVLPHREPFLLIDTVNICAELNTASANKLVLKDEWFFTGHFPGLPIMPGVLIIEAMAQTAAVLAITLLGEEAYNKPVYFLGVNNAKFRAPVIPNTELVITAVLKRKIRNVWIFICRTKLNNQTLVAEAEIMATIQG